MTKRIYITSEQARAARALLNWTLANAAKNTGVSAATLGRFEDGADIQHGTMMLITIAYQDAGIEFTEDGWIRLHKE